MAKTEPSTKAAAARGGAQPPNCRFSIGLHSLLWRKADDINAIAGEMRIVLDLVSDLVEGLGDLPGLPDWLSPSLLRRTDKLRFLESELQARTDGIHATSLELLRDIAPLRPPVVQHAPEADIADRSSNGSKGEG